MSKKSIRFSMIAKLGAIWYDENNCRWFSATDIVPTIKDGQNIQNQITLLTSIGSICFVYYGVIEISQSKINKINADRDTIPFL